MHSFIGFFSVSLTIEQTANKEPEATIVIPSPQDKNLGDHTSTPVKKTNRNRGQDLEKNEMYHSALKKAWAQDRQKVVTFFENLAKQITKDQPELCDTNAHPGEILTAFFMTDEYFSENERPHLPSNQSFHKLLNGNLYGFDKFIEKLELIEWILQDNWAFHSFNHRFTPAQVQKRKRKTTPSHSSPKTKVTEPEVTEPEEQPIDNTLLTANLNGFFNDKENYHDLVFIEKLESFIKTKVDELGIKIIKGKQGVVSYLTQICQLDATQAKAVENYIRNRKIKRDSGNSSTRKGKSFFQRNDGIIEKLVANDIVRGFIENYDFPETKDTACISKTLSTSEGESSKDNPNLFIDKVGFDLQRDSGEHLLMNYLNAYFNISEGILTHQNFYKSNREHTLSADYFDNSLDLELQEVLTQLGITNTTFNGALLNFSITVFGATVRTSSGYINEPATSNAITVQVKRVTGGLNSASKVKEKKTAKKYSNLSSEFLSKKSDFLSDDLNLSQDSLQDIFNKFFTKFPQYDKTLLTNITSIKAKSIIETISYFLSATAQGYEPKAFYFLEGLLIMAESIQNNNASTMIGETGYYFKKHPFFHFFLEVRPKHDYEIRAHSLRVPMNDDMEVLSSLIEGISSEHNPQGHTEIISDKKTVVFSKDPKTLKTYKIVLGEDRKIIVSIIRIDKETARDQECSKHDREAFKEIYMGTTLPLKKELNRKTT